MFNNIPEVKLGLIAVSRDCFVISLSERRRAAVAAAYEKLGGEIYECKVTVENEKDMLRAVEDVKAAGCTALVVFLGNFGPETPETLIAQNFDGPVMYAAAAEESMNDLINGRGDAYCGVLNCSYNLGLRKIKAVMPEYPVGDAEDVAKMILDFVPVARALIGVSGLKIITFGPRPQDFFACNAPIKPLYDIGVEIQENSELDLLVSYKEHANDPRIAEVVEDMAKELGVGNQYPDLLPRMAQYELTLLDWIDNNIGARKYVAFANKCWPAFPSQFGFEPCYVNSRLVSRGIPVACEVDIYGALSEFIGLCVSGEAVTLLDINNTVPKDMYEAEIKGKYDYKLTDTFMGFHCGNTPLCKLCSDACSRTATPRISPAAPSRATSRRARSPSTACTAARTAPSSPTSRRARFCRLPPAPSAASACSPSRRWAASTAMCSSASTIRTTARWPSVTAARRSSPCSSIWACRISPTTVRPPCPTTPRTPSADLRRHRTIRALGSGGVARQNFP